MGNKLTKGFDSKFINDLSSYDNFKSNSAYNEIMFSYGIMQKIGKENILFYSKLSNGKIPDFKITLDKKIVIELTGLNIRSSEQTIK